MIGILLVTHGDLAKEMIGAMEHVVGKQEQVDMVCIGENDDVEKSRLDIIEKVQKLDSGDGVCIATDMFGGTPSNLAISVMKNNQVEVVAGLNLPMLIKLVRLRSNLPLKEVAEQSAQAGRKYINVASELLKNE
ncbi:MAG: PTS sugar transporter subunit IIA [Alphaproteobacteria bacterium]|nr:PTS sugar transporter subunit IIA [Alphaproteobacteria bacterium]